MADTKKFLIQVTAEGYGRGDGVYSALGHDTMDSAVEAAGEYATRTQSTVYVFQAVKKIAPKQEVVVTDLT